MKFSINQSELQDALAVVLKGIATRSTLPILSGIYLDAHNDNLSCPFNSPSLPWWKRRAARYFPASCSSTS